MGGSGFLQILGCGWPLGTLGIRWSHTCIVYGVLHKECAEVVLINSHASSLIAWKLQPLGFRIQGLVGLGFRVQEMDGSSWFPCQLRRGSLSF